MNDTFRTRRLWGDRWLPLVLTGGFFLLGAGGVIAQPGLHPFGSDFLPIAALLSPFALLALSTVPFVLTSATVDDSGIRALNYVRRLDVPWTDVVALTTINRKTPWIMMQADEYEYIQIHLASGQIFEPKAMSRRSTISRGDVETLIRLARQHGLSDTAAPDSLAKPFPKHPGYMAQLGLNE
jgi:hypothetical protein